MAELIAAEHSLCPRSAVPPVVPPCPNPPHYRRDLPDHPARAHLTSSQVSWPMLAGVEAAEEPAEGSRRRRSASTRVLRCCVQPGRAAVAGAT